MSRRATPQDRAVYIISVVAELAGIHPQTLRMYERKGLLDPKRTAGNSRRYSQRDIDRLNRIQELTQLGINLAGVRTILRLEHRLEELESRLEKNSRKLAVAVSELQRRRTEDRRGVLVRLADVASIFDGHSKMKGG